jgi:large subunit ribosomal protein L4
MKLAVHNAEGKQVRQITVDDAVFGITPNLAVLHQALYPARQQRRGTASTKSRGEVQAAPQAPQEAYGSARAPASCVSAVALPGPGAATARPCLEDAGWPLPAFG